MTASENQIIVYHPTDSVELGVCLGNDTIWLTQTQLYALFQRDISIIRGHIKNIFAEKVG